MQTDAGAVRERLLANPDRAGLVLDFDGTLAPIVENPAAAALPADLIDVLATLSRGLAVVAVVSGRPAPFLAQQVPCAGVRLLGLYGLQECVDGALHVRPEAAEWEGAVDAAEDALASALVAVRGVVLEDKGLSVALHWRNAPDREQAQRFVEVLAARVAQQTGLRREPGKFVEELRPPVDWDKGSSVRALASELNLTEVVFIGDDLGDLPAFAAVRELGGAGLLVAQGADTPPLLSEAADAVLAGTDEAARWLTDLAGALSSGPRSPG